MKLGVLFYLLLHVVIRYAGTLFNFLVCGLNLFPELVTWYVLV